MTIKRLTVRNFKSIRELQLELAPLTILVGPNGSGKSSILEALALMSQSSRRNVYPRSREAIIGGEGALVEYDELNSILHRGLSDVELALGITVDMQVDEMESGIKEDLRASSTEEQSSTSILKSLARAKARSRQKGGDRG
jgi:predicted ATPase